VYGAVVATAAVALGFVVTPVVVAELAWAAHAVLPELFVALGLLGGGSLALLFVAVAGPSTNG
jgi:hypothetical protein